MPHRDDEVKYDQNLWGTYDYDLEKSFEQNVELAKQHEALITIEKLLNIEAGITKVEKQEGPRGEHGRSPQHRWESQTQIRFENPDGTWGDLVDLNPETVIIHQDQFTAEANQETFKLKSGAYRMGTNSVAWYLDGVKQRNDTLQEISPTEVKIEGGVPEGSTVLFDYIEFVLVSVGLKGDQGIQGPRGLPAKHEWLGKGQIRFENPDGTWGETIDFSEVEGVNYATTRNKPRIGSVELSGDKSFEDLGLTTIKNSEIDNLF